MKWVFGMCGINNLSPPESKIFAYSAMINRCGSNNEIQRVHITSSANYWQIHLIKWTYFNYFIIFARHKLCATTYSTSHNQHQEFTVHNLVNNFRWQTNTSNEMPFERQIHHTSSFTKLHTRCWHCGQWKHVRMTKHFRIKRRRNV